MTYLEKLKDPRWQKKRLHICERDGWKCRDCLDENETLHIHHAHYVKGDPWETPDEYLMTLCAPCHESRQKLEDEGKRLLAEMFIKCGDIAQFVGSMREIVDREQPAVCLFSDGQMAER